MGEQLTETFTVKAADGTETTVTITIDGTNDVPTISGPGTAAATEDVEQTVSGQLTAADVDTSDTHTWSVSGEPKGQYGTISVDQTGKWTYTIDQQATRAGQGPTGPGNLPFWSMTGMAERLSRT